MRIAFKDVALFSRLPGKPTVVIWENQSDEGSVRDPLTNLSTKANPVPAQ